MKNMQIAGTGNSRFMKSEIPETATWEEFLEMLRAGTFAFDLNGINEAGITERGTPYDVNSVLKDSTAELLGGDSSMVPDEAFVALKALFDNANSNANSRAEVVTGSYTGTSESSSANPKVLTFSAPPKVVFISPKTSSSTASNVPFCLIRGYESGRTPTASGSTPGSINVTWTGNSVSFYNAFSQGTFVYAAIL